MKKKLNSEVDKAIKETVDYVWSTIEIPKILKNIIIKNKKK
jgi:hypothetical protein